MKNTADTLRLGLEAGGHYDHSEDMAEWVFLPEQLEKLISAVRTEERAALNRTSLGFSAIMDLMDTVPRGTFYGVDRGDAMRIWLLAASATEKAHGIKEAKK